MTTAQSIIESSYARSTANDAGKLASDGELLLLLNRKYQSLYAIMAVNGGDNALVKAALTFAAGPPITVTIPTDSIDLVRFEKADETRAYIIPANEKDRSWHFAPAVFRVGNTLVSRGLTGDPAAADIYNLYHLDAPTALTALSTTLDARFPVRYEDILVLDLAIYLSVKDEGRNPQEFTALKTEYADAISMFNRLVVGSNSAKESPRMEAVAKAVK